MSFIDDHKELGFSQQARQPQPNPTAMKAVEIADVFNPHWVKEEIAKATPGLGAVRNFLGNAQAMFGEGNKRRQIVDVYKTQAANERDVEQLIGKIEQKVFAELAPAKRALAASKASLQSNINSLAAINTPDNYAPEIRAAFKAMKPADAVEAANAAVDSGDRQTLAAILDAPTLTTGLAADLRAALKNRYLNSVAPESMQLLAEHEKAEERLATAERLILPTITQLYEGTNKHKEAQELLAQIQANYAE